MAHQPGLIDDATAEQLQEMLKADQELPENQRRWPQDLAALLMIVEAAAHRHGLSKDLGFRLAAEASREFSRYAGGRLLYIPRGVRIDQALRDAEIWRRFNGRNVNELAIEFQLTVQTVYEILREQRAAHSQKHQGQLFEGTEG